MYSRALALVNRLDGAVQVKTQITILGKRGETRLTRSQFSDAAEDFSQLVEQARSRDDAASEFSGLTSLTQALFFSHRLDETAERAGQALAVAERGKNAAWQADVLNLVGLKQLCYGELKDAKQSLDNAIALARSVGHTSALAFGLTWRAALHYWQSAYAKADEMLVEAIQLNAALRNGFQLLASLFFRLFNRIYG